MKSRDVIFLEDQTIEDNDKAEKQKLWLFKSSAKASIYRSMGIAL